jgi:hypothetical protein
MTDPSFQPVAPIDAQVAWQRYLEQAAARDALFETLLPENQSAILDSLASVGVATLIVTFDGYGDSGQIETITATGPDGEMVLPEIGISYATPGDLTSDDPVNRRQVPLTDVIETLCYDLLRSTHAGWENNDGAFGDFTFDVAARTISLDHNDRYTAIESYTHQW